MAVKYTPQQKQAIETLDKSVLVSAAAGSGKTAILIQRILRIILEGRADVDELLVVTFTKAAASEMKLRLSSAISRRMREHPEDAARMRRQQNLLSRAYISTIDSFALRVVREFFYKTDMDPDCGICDDVQGEILRREALNSLFEDGFARDDIIEGGSFRAFLRLYSSDRSDDTFKEDMLASYSRLRTMPEYFDWALSKAEALRMTAEDFDGSDIAAAVMADARYTMAAAVRGTEAARRLMEDAGLGRMYQDKLAPEAEAVRELYETARSGAASEFMEAAANFSGVTLRASKDEKESYEAIKAELKKIRESYKKEIKDLRGRYFMPDPETRIKETAATYEHTIYYIKLLMEFEKRYAAAKKEKHVMDFADMEHTAAAILADEEAAATLRRRFRYIFVDEYQDTNNIQEYLISKVSRPDNVFRVGDVKQSIYKFRLAEPEIFESLYERFSKGEDPDSMVIDLSRNFRSNDATIRYVNRVFASVMEGYDERAMLYTGLSVPAEYDFTPELHILEDEGPAGHEAGGDEDASDPQQDDPDQQGGAGEDDIEDLSKEEAEAAYAAELAAGLVGTEFFDTVTGKVRKATPRDIVILLRAVSGRGDIYARALRERGLQVHVQEEEDYFDTIEIGLAMSLLSCVDNMKRDVPLIALLHSGVFGWSPEELALVRAEYREREIPEGQDSRRGAYWEALGWFAHEGPEGELRDKALFALGRIESWRRMSRMMPLADFVWKALTESGLYALAGAMNGGARRQANLRTLADRAGKYSSESVSSLSSFIEFVDVLKRRKIAGEQASVVGSEDDVIRISTIHKSKGLEFPFVIVGGLGHRFRPDSAGKKLSFDPHTGIGMPYVDPARRFWRPTILQKAVTAGSQRSSYKEELRVLYVAMTRARNKLILIGTCKGEDALKQYRPRPANYLEVLSGCLRTPDNICVIGPLDRTPVSAARHYALRIPDIPAGEMRPGEAKAYAEISRRFGYEYPDSGLLTAKAKYSVSELRRASLEAEAAELPDSESDGGGAAIARDDEVVRIQGAAERKKKASAADIGIAYHRIVEYLDFGRCIGSDGEPDEAYIRGQAEDLLEKGALDRDAYSGVRLSNINGFFRGELGRRAVAASMAGTLRKEKPFTLRTAWKDPSAAGDDAGGQAHDILVQGVIDCCFEEDGRMILIDYKSSFIRRGAEHGAELDRIRREYSTQIRLYAEAITKGTGLEVAEAYLYLFATGETLRLI